jgi:hypothetical protein
MVAYPAGTTMPAVSSLNAAPGDVVNRLVMVPIGALGSISVFNQSGSVHFTVDVIGYFETTCCGGQGRQDRVLERETNLCDGTVRQLAITNGGTSTVNPETPALPELSRSPGYSTATSNTNSS